VADLLRDRYEPLEIVGVGGEGRVVKALDHQHDRIVALKIRTVEEAQDRDAMLSEARVLLAIPPHPHVPLVRDDFFDGDQYVIAMDWVEGTDLGRLLQARGRPGLGPSLVLGWLADPSPCATPTGRPRRREAGQPRADRRWTGGARRLRAVLVADLGPPTRRDAWLRRA
jgi:Protein kinase domain